MPNVFDDIRFEWDGKEYTIPGNRVMRLLQFLGGDERKYTTPAIARIVANEDMANMCGVFGLMVHYANRSIDPEEVAERMYAAFWELDGDKTATIQGSCATLMAMVFPGHKMAATAKKKTVRKKRTKKKATRKTS